MSDSEGPRRPTTDRRLSTRPNEIVWRDQMALSPGAKFAVLLGDPSQAGSYAFRLRAPTGHRAMPHSHPEERVYTVLSGTFYLGFGHQFVDSRLEDYPEGSVVIVRPDRVHFQLAKEHEYVVQIEGVGPTAVRYMNPADDPRHPKDAPVLPRAADP
jgi:quercetin dioxygenase-like cupin family protein